MHTLDMTEAQKIVRCIQNPISLPQRDEAMALIDKWLFEKSIGLLDMSPAVERLLEDAYEPQQRH